MAHCQKLYQQLIISHDTPKKVPKRHTPSICVRSEAFDKSNLGPIISKCKANEIPDNVAVVLAPSPLDFYSPVPHIFYDINYLLPEFEENYPNSVTFLPWQPVVHALVRFLQEMAWKRIAVISDDSYFSEIFENELISRFNELEFVYAVKQCLYNMNDEYDQAKNNCFDKGLSELKYTNQEYKVRIIIANVEDYNIAKLMEAARSNGITAHWIFRCPVQNKHRKGFPFIDIFSIKLSAFDMNYDEEDYNLRARISHVNNTLRTVDWSNKTILYEHIKKSFPMQIDVRATIMRGDYRFGTIDISGNKVQNVRLNKPSFSDLPNCYVRSNNFDRPCDNFLIFLLFLVLIMFLLILLIISIYFNNIRTVNGQYLNIL
ncbi:uncharacterized protein LOC131842186 isoform X2 [Achroia grisella]|uniref:uncharacterized protein LOC131842186 isoform X2 n=1 Tax=Achroia grisella TaxID=688607 RepID=UPI0027D2CBD6|nr:uncharacterized protein LOC131842186 isoform X2 [Achroia grisella]